MLTRFPVGWIRDARLHQGKGRENKKASHAFRSGRSEWTLHSGILRPAEWCHTEIQMARSLGRTAAARGKGHESMVFDLAGQDGRLKRCTDVRVTKEVPEVMRSAATLS